MNKISVIGANGYIGSHIVKHLSANNSIIINKITRGDSLDSIESSDHVIHVANPAKRFKAKNDPEWDFNETVLKTKLIKDTCDKLKVKLTLVSSISARTQLNTIYGLNRRSAELIMNNNDLILRVGPVYGGNKNVGPLYDIFNNREVFVAAETKSAYANVNYYAKKIVELTINNEKGILELGAKDFLVLKDFKKTFSSISKFSGEKDHQVPVNTFEDSPSVKEVYDYFKNL